MILNKLSILNYKNIRQAELAFSPKLNCFLGNNGMGKTNLLDAVYYLSFCRSYLNTPDTQVISWEQNVCVVQGDYAYEGREEEIFCALRRGQKKVFRRNKKEYERLSDHIGLLPLVMVSPLDSILIQGGSEERRRFMDLIISQQDKTYLQALIQYNKVLVQRNALLKAVDFQPAFLEVLDQRLTDFGRVVYEGRRRMIEEFTPIFNRYYQAIAGSSEEIRLRYVSQLDEADLRDLLARGRERDRVVGYTTMGIHKDELEMKLEDFLIRRIGSQGQNKSFLIALKLAQFAFLKAKSGTAPLLLLDDIFDKLDAERVARIISLVRQEEFGQIFITDTNRKYLDEILSAVADERVLFEVERGEARLMV